MQVSRLWNLDDATLKMIIFHSAVIFCRVCLVMCVTGGFHFFLAVRPAVGEGDDERVQCGFPSCDPSYLAFAAWVEQVRGQVEAFQCGLLTQGSARARGWSGGTGRSDVRIALVEQLALRISAS